MHAWVRPQLTPTNVSLGQQTIQSGAHTRVFTTRESPPGPSLRISTSDRPSVFVPIPLVTNISLPHAPQGL